MSDEKTAAALNQLMRGLGHGGMRDTYLGYRALYRIGAEAIPAAEHLIFQRDWSTLSRPEESRILAALVSLVHDIDESASRRIIGKISAKGCKPVTRAYLESIASFTLKDYCRYKIREIDIFESKRIGHRHRVESRLRDWLSTVPAADLAGIERIYVITFSDDKEYGGKYMPLLCHITLVWRDRHHGMGPIAWFFRLLHEKTLYHEIGHHYHDHTFGQDPEQEKQANDYAYRFMRANHPWLTRIARALVVVVRPVVRVVRDRIQNRGVSKPKGRETAADREPRTHDGT